MSDHVFVVSEWLPKEGCEDQLWEVFKRLMQTTRENEPGCIRAHATRQIPHRGAPSTSKYKIVLLQEYENVEAFDAHCDSDHVAYVVETYLNDEVNSIIEEWQCRLFHE